MSPELLFIPEPTDLMPYRNAVRNGFSETCFLPFYQAQANWVPEGFDGMVLTADLQGMVENPSTGLPELMGLAVVDKLMEMHFDGLIPDPGRMAALLMGDYFALPDTRGGFGCVAEVWDAFGQTFAHVVGVAGNHDDISQVRCGRNVELLDTEVTELGSLRIGGVGYSIGNARRSGKRDELDQFEHMKRIAEEKPDLWIVHEGPAGGAGQPGVQWISEMLEANQIPITLCGHIHWKQPLYRSATGIVVNAHERVIVVRRGM
jgi:3',5'-cyclic-AMP phosphodiesterase